MKHCVHYHRLAACGFAILYTQRLAHSASFSLHKRGLLILKRPVLCFLLFPSLAGWLRFEAQCNRDRAAENGGEQPRSVVATQHHPVPPWMSFHLRDWLHNVEMTASCMVWPGCWWEAQGGKQTCKKRVFCWASQGLDGKQSRHRANRWVS